MADSPKRTRSPSQSSHYSQAEIVLAQNGVFADDVSAEDGSADMDPSDQRLLTTLLEETRATVAYSSVPLNKVRATIGQVPSPNILALCGVPHMEILEEELNSDWTGCVSMGETRPKPDLTVGLSHEAFTTEELAKFWTYVSTDRASFVTPHIIYPFLVCKAKSGQVGLEKANVQNLHSAAIAVRAVFTLYEHAYGIEAQKIAGDLEGRLLVFSVSHNHDQVLLYGHYALGAGAASRRYYRYPIATSSLTFRDGQRRLTAYNFVRNVYEIYAPLHLQRIQAALARLPGPTPSTPSLGEASASEAEVEADSRAGSDEASQSSDASPNNRPTSRANAARTRETVQLRRQVQELMRRLEEQAETKSQREQQMQEQMKQQWEQMQEQMRQQRELMQEQLRQQRDEGARRERQMQDQMQDQTQDGTSLLRQLLANQQR